MAVADGLAGSYYVIVGGLGISWLSIVYLLPVRSSGRGWNLQAHGFFGPLTLGMLAIAVLMALMVSEIVPRSGDFESALAALVGAGALGAFLWFASIYWREWRGVGDIGLFGAESRGD